ncbi:uncharacterized protein LOC142176125 [Nicotiana tabacum]|uniref:Uncharacterized protein LOC142176125 n=1 Tax=Nicotiana tabacum TaxID=4097 RepID=A0AC58TQ25_TOBAC
MAPSVASAESMGSLSSDLFYDILRRLDGATLASAACACEAFSSISKEEKLWENILRKFNMKLNPEKCAFGVSSGKFLGFLISNSGIEVNPAQIKAIEEILDILTSKKEVQRLTGRIKALGRFISKSLEKCFKFFSDLKKQNQFEWSKEFQQALKNLKAYLSNPPFLAKPKDGEKLLIYLAVSAVAPGDTVGGRKELQVFNRSNPGVWTLLTDGSSNVKGAGLGIVLVPPAGETIRQAIKCHPITNNEAEYEAAIAGLELARELGIKQIPRKENAKADGLANLVSAVERKMFDDPLARCLGPSQMEYVMKEIHEELYGNHAEGRSLVKTIIRARYYWPKMEEEAESFVAKCDRYQRYGNNMHQPAELLHPVIALWPFMKWRMDIVGALPQAKVKIGEPSTRYTQATKELNEEEMRVNLDLLEERRETTLIRMTSQKQVIERYYNRKARLRYFKIGDYVLKKVFQSTGATNVGKLSPNWEGPYKIYGIARKGAYELESLDDKILPSNWNDVNLKKYYF